MKKLIAISVALLTALLAGGIVYASSSSDTVGVLLTVNPSFSLTLGDAVIDMGSVAEGNSGVGGTTMYCVTNQGNPWTVRIKSTTIVGGVSLEEIPLNPNFTFQTFAVADGGAVNSAGTFISTDTVLTLVDQTAYTAAASEYSDTDCRVGLVLALDVPYGQQADTYAATVTCTMTE